MVQSPGHHRVTRQAATQQLNHCSTPTLEATESDETGTSVTENCEHLGRNLDEHQSPAVSGRSRGDAHPHTAFNNLGSELARREPGDGPLASTSHLTSGPW